MKLCLTFVALLTLVRIVPVRAFLPPASQTTKSPTATLALSAHGSTKIDRNVYDPSKIDGQKFDTIVIGSGIGGLSAASLLAQSGQKVLVLEQHYVAGGACHTFESKGYRFATGVHYVGEVGDESKASSDLSFGKLLDNLTPANDPVVWDRMDENYETVVVGDPSNRFEIVTGEDALKSSLIKQFPNEKKAIEKYLKLCKKAFVALRKGSMWKLCPLPLARFLTRTGLYRIIAPKYNKWSRKSVKEVIEGLTSNKELQTVMARNWVDYGVEPSRAPFFLQAAVAQHYMDGGYYPRGGPSVIPRKIIKEINNCNGKVLVSAPVKRILLDDDAKKVTGVELEDGHIVHADTVVSDAGLITTATKLLPSGIVKTDFAEDSRASFGKLHPSLTGMALFVGLKGDQQALKLPNTVHLVFPSADMEGNVPKINQMSLDEALNLNPDELGMFIGVPSTREKSWADEHPNKSVLEILMLAPWHWFEPFSSFYDKKTRSHGPDYEAVKKTFAEKMWSRTVEVLEPTGAKLPRTLDKVDHYQVGTPLTFEHYYGSEHGAWYRLENDIQRFKPKNYFLRLRPEVPEVSGLYLTGEDVISDGLSASAASGLFCALKVLGKANPLSLFRDEKASNGQEKQQKPKETHVAGDLSIA